MEIYFQKSILIAVMPNASDDYSPICFFWQRKVVINSDFCFNSVKMIFALN